eukprot:2098423-Alexandrium_andersonii.AAC.1
MWPVGCAGTAGGPLGLDFGPELTLTRGLSDCLVWKRHRNSMRMGPQCPADPGTPRTFAEVQLRAD